MQNDEFPNPDEFNASSASDAAKKERDEQERLFQEKLKRMSDEAEADAEAKQSSFDFSEEESEDEPFKPELAGDLQNPKESYDLY